MYRSRSMVFILCFAFTFLFSPNKAQAMDPKVKAFGVMCAYGTVGGALLGFASLAFGTNGRAIAQGASLGLYSGIIFGAYVLSSYNQGQSDSYDYPENDPYAPPDQYNMPSPNSGGMMPAAPGQYPSGGEDSGFFGPPNRVQEIQNDYTQKFRSLRSKNNFPSFRVNLLNVRF